MTDQQTDAQPDAPTDAPTAATSQPKDRDGYAAAFKALQADVSRLESDLKAEAKKRSEAERERDDFRSRVDGYVKREAEGRLYDKLRAALPHAEPLALRGVLVSLAEAGKVNRYPNADELDAVAAAALDLIGKEAPSMTRAPAGGGGVGGAPSGPPAVKKDALRSIFGAR